MLRRSEGVRIGVVGVGYWGSRHVRVLRSATGVASVIGVDQRLSGKTGSPQLIDCDVAGYPDLEAALPAVDAVIIATPPSSHYSLGLQAIEAGKHVLIEKPLAASLGEARALVDAAEAAGVVLIPGLTFLYNSAVHKLRDVVHGELGNLYYLDCQRLNLGLYQSDVNVVLDLAPHDISIANFVLNSARPPSPHGARVMCTPSTRMSLICGSITPISECRQISISAGSIRTRCGGSRPLAVRRWSFTTRWPLTSASGSTTSSRYRRRRAVVRCLESLTTSATWCPRSSTSQSRSPFRTRTS